MNRLDSIVQKRNCADLRAITTPNETLSCKMIRKKISLYDWDEQGRIIEVNEFYQLWDGSEVLSNWFLLEYLKNEIVFLDARNRQVLGRI